MSTETTRPRIHFKGLNAIRFFAAFAIVFYHALNGYSNEFPSVLKEFHHNLPIGVDIFFILSGFLITYLLLAEKAAYNTIKLSSFYMRRILRIFPLYFLIIAIGYIQFHNYHEPINFSKFLYFCGNFWMIDTGKWTVGTLNPLWSINIEEHFYLIVPALILFIKKRWLPYLFGAIILLSLGFRVYSTYTLEWRNWMTLYMHTLSRSDALALGGLIAYAHFYHSFRVNWKPMFTWIVVVVLLVFMCTIDSNLFDGYLNAAFRRWIFIVPLTLLLLGFALNKTKNDAMLDWVSSNKTINYLGKISFGLYMYHSAIIEWVYPIGFLEKLALVKILAVVVLTVVVSALSYEFFEKPILSLKKRFERIRSTR